MNRTLIITDLTRFADKTIVCIAGIDRGNAECVRPMPYLATSRCKELGILPGTILSGQFLASPDRNGPHQEDCQYANLTFRGPCSSSDFRQLLMSSLSATVEEGFEVALEPNQKHIPEGHPVKRSIITIATAPADVKIVTDTFKPGKIRLHFTDRSKHDFRYIPITDLGFHDYAMQYHANDDLNALNAWIHAQDEVLLRLGLSRSYKVEDGREGYWLQANGIYTFPDYYKAIRSYT
jgi:hypothetical protein